VAVAQRDEWIEQQAELRDPLGDLHGAPQLAFQLEADGEAMLHGAGEQLEAIATPSLGLVEGGVGVAQQILGRAPSPSADRDADAHTDEHVHAPDPARVTTGAHDVLGETDERLPFELASNKQGEAVPGPADEHGAIGNLLAQVLGHEPDDVVAGATIERVVRVTESVDVYQQNGDVRAGLTFGMFVDPTVEIALIRKVR